MPVSPSLTQKFLKFDQVRAKFNCSTASIHEVEINETTIDNNNKEKKQEEKLEVIGLNEQKTLQLNEVDTETTEQTANVVAIRRKVFEQHQEKTNLGSVDTKEVLSSPSSASQIAKNPSPPIKYPKPFFCEDLVPSFSSLSDNLEGSTPKAAEKNNGESPKGVKNMVEKLNRIGHRPFEPSASISNTCKSKQREVEIAEEVETDSSEHSENGEKSIENEERAGEKTGERKQSAVVGNELDVHADILEEMRGKAIFKKSFIASGIPSEFGKYRPLPSDRKCSRKGCASDPPPATHCQPGHSSENGTVQPTKTSSLISSKNGCAEAEEEQCLFVEHFGPIPQYSETDEKENLRLRKLHEVALEIYQKQRAYVMKLQLIGLNYPRHLNDCEKRMNKKLLHSKHVIRRIADHFQTILNVHLTFLHNFYDKILKWDSRKPDLAEVFQKNADFLKICRLFLTEKQKLVAELQQTLNENHELAEATLTFEQALSKETSTRHSFSGGSSNCASVNDLKGISIVLQLDAVHQNVVQYKLLMERYRKYLPDNLAEAKNAEEALKKLVAVTNDLNDSLTVEDEEKKLLELRAKLRGIFDVFAPGRRLLHTGELKRQTRKELQSRHLVLFSDTLLICRCVTLAPLDSLDAKYIIPIEKVKLNLPENDESECEFIVLTPYKSSTFIAKSKWERDHWMKRIGDASEEAIQRKATRETKQKLAGRGVIGQTWLSQELVTSSNDNESFRFYTTHNLPECSGEKQKPREKCPNGGTDTLTNGGEEQSDGAETPAEEKDEANANEEKGQMDASPNQHLFSPNTALWVPDNKTSKCMNRCGTSFALFRRRHHCRQCGCIICSNCEGMAPVGNAQGMFKRSKVCPKCFFDIRNAFERGFLPRKMPSSSQSPIDSSNHSKLFVAPANGPMNKSIKSEDGKVVSGRVFLRIHQKGTVPRWATLSAESSLQFYKAQFDDQPMEQFIIFGYSVRHSENEDDGKTQIELTHRNQFQTERKEDQIVFLVQHSESAKKWLDALQKVVQIEQTETENSQD
ncbi:hypothetical protein niasHT_003734 [Heterodera trifolii]|uniref:FYVE, RhoGEF and PH domain-containing protein 4 n=1 Tax=Heterodera trifolii TaxID=157864 RepID=A0ABD2LUP9_9BILA